MGNALKTTIVFAALAFAGCSTAPMPDTFVSHFDSARQDRGHGKCMSENAMFNNRQLMVTPNAVKSAWTYCVKRSDVWYPGREDTRTTSIGWHGR
jgi:hypothetical protein